MGMPAFIKDKIAKKDGKDPKDEEDEDDEAPPSSKPGDKPKKGVNPFDKWAKKRE